jgi:AcrR family transcriptional regulator
MTETLERPAGSRTPLTRERVLSAALELADRGGIEALSMRKLARELSVEAMSLYHYVRSKDEILEGILEVVLASIEIPTDEGNWKAALRRASLSAYKTLVAHPWAATVETPSMVSPARLRFMDFLLGTLRKAGFTADETDHAYHALDSHITGFTLWIANMPFKTNEELGQLAQRFIKVLPVEDYPYVVEHVEQHIEKAARPRREGEPTEFEFGLDLILDGLERSLKSR